jgi:hypothetical protein
MAAYVNEGYWNPGYSVGDYYHFYANCQSISTLSSTILTISNLSANAQSVSTLSESLLIYFTFYANLNSVSTIIATMSGGYPVYLYDERYTVHDKIRNYTVIQD